MKITRKKNTSKNERNSKGNLDTMSEAQHQIALVRYLSFFPNIHPFLFHIPNGGHRSPTEGAKFKRMGVKPGIPDLFLSIPSKSAHGLFIELKRSGGKLTTNQAEMIERLRSQNYTVEVCEGWKSAAMVIEKYLSDAY